MHSAGEMALVEQGVYYHNEVGIEGTAKLDPFLNTLGGRSARNLYPGAPVRPGVPLQRPDDPPVHAAGRHRSPGRSLEPASAAVAAGPGRGRPGRAEGGPRDGRHHAHPPLFARRRQEFKIATSLGRERQKAIYVRAVDTRGHEAVSRDITGDSWLLRDTQCADRNNQLLYSMQKRDDGTPFFVGYGGDTPMPDKGPWNGRTRPVGCFVFDAQLGVGAMSYDGSPEQHPQTWFSPSCWYGNKAPQSMGWESQLVAGREGAAHVEPRRVMHSSDMLIGERILDGVFPVDARPVNNVWHTLYPVKPSAFFRTTAREYLCLIKVDGVSVYLWDQEFEVLKDIPVKHPPGLCPRPGPRRRLDRHGPPNRQRRPDRGPRPTQGRPLHTVPFNRGDYIGLLRQPVRVAGRLQPERRPAAGGRRRQLRRGLPAGRRACSRRASGSAPGCSWWACTAR